MKAIAKTILTLVLLTSAVVALGGPSLPVFFSLLALCALCAKGLDKLGTFKA